MSYQCTKILWNEPNAPQCRKPAHWRGSFSDIYFYLCDEHYTEEYGQSEKTELLAQPGSTNSDQAKIDGQGNQANRKAV